MTCGNIAGSSPWCRITDIPGPHPESQQCNPQILGQPEMTLHTVKCPLRVGGCARLMEKLSNNLTLQIREPKGSLQLKVELQTAVQIIIS